MSGSIISFVENLPSNAEFKDFDTRKISNIPSLINAQNRVDELSVEKASIADAPFPSSEILETATAKIESLAEHGKPKLSYVYESGKTPDLFNTALVSNTGHSEAELQNAFWVWLNKDQILDRLTKEIKEYADDEYAIPAAQREDKYLKACINLQIAERAEVLSSDSEANDAQYRSFLSPEAILMIEQLPIK